MERVENDRRALCWLNARRMRVYVEKKTWRTKKEEKKEKRKRDTKGEIEDDERNG